MKKILLSFLLLCTTLACGGTSVVYAQTTEDLFSTDPNKTQLIGEETLLRDYTFDSENFGQESQNRGEKHLRTMVEIVNDYTQKLVILIGILITIRGGVQLFLSRGKEEVFEEKKRHIYGLMFGFMTMLLATVLIDKVFFGEYGQFLDTVDTSAEFSQRGVMEMEGIFKYFTSFAVIAGVAFILFSALKLIFAAGEDEGQISKLKKRLVYTIGGMAILVSTEKVIDLFTSDGKIDVPNIPGTIELAIDWANFILGFLGVLAIFGIVWGGIRLVFSFGVDDNGVEIAKKVIMASVIGLVVAFSAWTIMYYFLAHQVP